MVIYILYFLAVIEMSADIFRKAVVFITYLDYICEKKDVFLREIENAILQCSMLREELSQLDDNAVFIKALDIYEKKMLEFLDRFNKG